MTVPTVRSRAYHLAARQAKHEGLSEQAIKERARAAGRAAVEAWRTEKDENEHEDEDDAPAGVDMD